jgi:hypothetical protein
MTFFGFPHLREWRCGSLKMLVQRNLKYETQVKTLQCPRPSPSSLVAGHAASPIHKLHSNHQIWMGTLTMIVHPEKN